LNTRLLAVGTPDELERSVGGRKTVVKLEQASEAVLTALKRLQPRDLSVEGSTITIGVSHPEKENPTILDTIFRAGGRIQSVNVVGSTLEDTYLKLVREKN
jgi:ABC-2 type transport system ATP-binding protein